VYQSVWFGSDDTSGSPLVSSPSGDRSIVTSFAVVGYASTMSGFPCPALLVAALAGVLETTGLELEYVTLGAVANLVRETENNRAGEDG
jgi:hypothetical protein